MADINKMREIAETYLDEMISAEKSRDYKSWTQRFEIGEPDDFDENTFLESMEEDREELGNYIDREYLGVLKGFEESKTKKKYPGCQRFVWRGIFEKNETIIVLGVYEKHGTLYVNENMYL